MNVALPDKTLQDRTSAQLASRGKVTAVQTFEVVMQAHLAAHRDADLAALEAGARHMTASIAKRLFDIVGALLGLLLFAPLLAVISIAVRLDSPGPAIFRQLRTGRGGTGFTIYKFRTMVVQDNGAEILQAQKGDVRTTSVGAFLRRSSLDELPQLFNVLMGDMSLIGPRPHALAHDFYYHEALDTYAYRYLVRPGLSGLAQVAGHRGQTASVGAMAARVEFDLAYIRNWSFGLDMQILLKTFFCGFFHPAAY